jgi:hypothetical protein
MEVTRGRRILLVGAYERDNFGDILFGLLTRDRLRARGHTVVLSSMVFSDMRGIFGEFVHAYDTLLQAYSWDAVWVVGGEVGSARVDEAARLTLQLPTSRLYAADVRSTDSVSLRAQLGAPSGDLLAYIPDLDSYPRNQKTVLIANSVGGFRNNGRANYLASHASFASISCRDEVSYEAVRELQFSNRRLAPDLVHSMPDDFSFKTTREKYLLFQVSEAIALNHDLSVVGRTLAQLAQEHDCSLLLFPAGEAPGHDSRVVYQELRDSVEAHNAAIRVERISERHPVVLSGLIANAYAWIGSSLHGRVISAAYGVPRVSLDKPKVNDYASEWDPEMPHSVDLANIEQALRQAVWLRGGDTRGEELRRLARDNFDDLVADLESLPSRVSCSTPTEADLAYETLRLLRQRAESDFRKRCNP